MTAIINSRYVIENVVNFSLTLQNIFLEFKSQEDKEKAIEKLKGFKIGHYYSATEIQFPANSNLTSISIFEN